MGMEMPAPLHWVLGFLGLDAWPKADEDALREMSAAYSAASQSVRAAADRTDNGANNLISVIDGDVGQAMTKYFGDIAGSGGLAGIADDLALCGQACEQTADATFEGKVEYVASVAMFAAVVAQALAAGPFTLGASTAEIPIAAAVTRVALWQIVKRLVAENAAAVAKQLVSKEARQVVGAAAKSAATTVLKAAPKNFAIGAGMEAGKEGVVSLGTGENHFDASKIIAQGAINTVTAPAADKIVSRTQLRRSDPDTFTVRDAAPNAGGKMVVNGQLKTGTQAVHDQLSPDTADDVKATSSMDVAKAVPSAVANTPEAARDAREWLTTSTEQPSILPQPGSGDDPWSPAAEPRPEDMPAAASPGGSSSSLNLDTSGERQSGG